MVVTEASTSMLGGRYRGGEQRDSATPSNEPNITVNHLFVSTQIWGKSGSCHSPKDQLCNLQNNVTTVWARGHSDRAGSVLGKERKGREKAIRIESYRVQTRTDRFFYMPGMQVRRFTIGLASPANAS